MISENFNTSRMRNMEVMNNEDGRRLFGFMTAYSGSNFCWIHPTRIRSNICDEDYHNYLKAINHKYRSTSKHHAWHSMERPHVGSTCVAQYEGDMKWYRALIVDEMIDGKWLVYFIDYGNFQRCDSLQINDPILDPPKCDHFQAPLQGVCCRLYNILPRLPEHREEIDKALEKFYAEHTKDYLEIVVRNVRPDYVVDCDMFLCDRRGPQNLYRKHIGQELVDSGLACFSDPTAAYAIKPPSKPVEFMNHDMKPERVNIISNIGFDTQYKYKTINFF